MASVNYEGKEYEIVREVPDPSFTTKKECNAPDLIFLMCGHVGLPGNGWLVLRYIKPLPKTGEDE